MSETEERVTVSQGGDHFAYHVEVRSSKGVRTLLGEHYSEEWTRFTPKQSCLPPSQIYKIDSVFGLHTYESAMAIAWMVMAYSQSFAEPNAYGIQVRLVQSRVTYSYRAVRHKEFPNIPWRGHGNEDP
jgi:hypothetical protein